MSTARRLPALPGLAPVVALLVALLVGCLAACGEDTGASVVLDAPDGTAVTGSEVSVVVPAGGWTFTISDPVDSPPDDVEGAAGDGPWVGVAWSPTSDAPAFGAVLHGTDPQTALVELDTGSDSAEVTRLGDPAQGGSANGAVWVRAEDAALAITYDGLTQRLDLGEGTLDPGAAAGFYRDDPELSSDCAGGLEGEWQASVLTCETSGLSVPYVAELGWVDDESLTWWVVDLRVGVGRFDRDGAGYQVRNADGVASLDGTEAEVLSESSTPEGGWTATVAVTAPAQAPGTLVVERTWALTRDDGSSSAPESGEATAAWSVDLPARAGD